MYAFILDELMLATAQEVREQARLARPHASRRPARLLARVARGPVRAGHRVDASAAEAPGRHGGCC